LNEDSLKLCTKLRRKSIYGTSYNSGTPTNGGVHRANHNTSLKTTMTDQSWNWHPPPPLSSSLASLAFLTMEVILTRSQNCLLLISSGSDFPGKQGKLCGEVTALSLQCTQSNSNEFTRG
jgi:hypothetical protein